MGRKRRSDMAVKAAGSLIDITGKTLKTKGATPATRRRGGFMPVVTAGTGLARDARVLRHEAMIVQTREIRAVADRKGKRV